MNTKWRVSPDGGEMFVDNQARKRSGHMGQALVEYAKDCILAFTPNNSAAIEHGHTGYGWMEYKRSTDAGETWSDPYILKYSWDSFIDGTFNVSCEKAVATDDGTIVVFCLRNKTITRWEPYLEPMVLRSTDGGETWSDALPFSGVRGRVMDALYKDGVIYALEFCNDAEIYWTGNKPEHVYKLYVSTDNGLTFSEKSVLPFDTLGRSYGALEWLPDGRLIACDYNENDEFNMDCCISGDLGATWGVPFVSFCKKRIRNPQICTLNGVYFLHGRSGNNNPSLPFNFVLYASSDGIHWDDGIYLYESKEGEWGNTAFYSDHCVTGRFGGKRRILIQSSVPYDEGRVNVMHWWIDVD